MQFKLNSFIALMLLFLISNLIAACSTIGTTKPNTPYTGSYPDEFKIIEERNPLLAKELGKLPELQDGISESEKTALNRLCELYTEDPESFDHAFEKMYLIGIPEVRKYCSPLQALFWLAEDGKSDALKDVVRDYELLKLLRISWRSRFANDDSFNLSTDDTILIVNKYVKDIDIGPMLQSRKRSYASSLDMYMSESDPDNKYRKLQNIKDKIQMDYRINPNRFGWGGQRIIKKALFNKSGEARWKDFDDFIDRLNAPELVDFWISSNLEYQRGYIKSPYQVFKTNNAHCESAAILTETALKDGGYNTFIRDVAWGSWGPASHAGAGIIHKDGSYLVVCDFGQTGVNYVSGPYKDVNNLDLKLSNGRPVKDAVWGSYFPIGHHGNN